MAINDLIIIPLMQLITRTWWLALQRISAL